VSDELTVVAQAALRAQELDPAALLTGELLVFGGTGFLGKVWLSMLLDRCPAVHVNLIVRPKAGMDSATRFATEIAPSRVFGGRDVTGRITPVSGDVSEAFAGVSDAERDRLRGRLQSVVNVAGVVDFNPPLDQALKVNAYGMQNLVSLVADLGAPPLLHTSTCYVAGTRTGNIDEVDPRDWPFPKADVLTDVHWDPKREIAECADLIEGLHHRTRDAYRRSLFENDARERLERTGEPLRGSALADEIERAERRWLDAELASIGKERAGFWGWPNTYTYTKSIGEQILAASGLRFAIARPAVVESALRFPEPGWNEGITTSAPIMYLSMKGMTGMPAGERSVLDVIPVDVVSAGMILALAELVEGTAAPVYQLGTSDTNPLKMTRLIELTGLYKRRKAREGRGDGGPLWNWLQGQYETVPVTEDKYLGTGPAKTAEVAKSAASWLRGVAEWVPAARGLAGAAADAVDGLGKQASGTARVIDQFLPFVARHDYRFSCANARAARARLSDAGRQAFRFDPEDLDWRAYWLDVHVPGVEAHVWPRIEERIHRERKPHRAHDDLVALVLDAAERFGDQPALQLRTPEGLATRTYSALESAARGVAGALRELGVSPGDRVVVAGRNHPDWAAAWFGVVMAGGVVVPVDRELPPEDLRRIAAKAGTAVALLDAEAAERFGDVLTGHRIAPLSVRGLEVELQDVDADSTAAILFTSGTTGDPKGVVLTHRNFCALLGSLASVFDLGADDRVLSVLPLHHTFEFSCGLLLPLSRGARVVYLDELTGEALASALAEAQVTAMVGVPALWQLLERRIAAQAADRGWLASKAFDAGLEFNRVVGRTVGIDAGRLLFGAVHDRLGGNIRLLISGGAALPAETHRFFAGLGLPLAEGYGLTEAAPVLTASVPKPGGGRGAGKPIPGVEVKIVEPDEAGVGQVVARGANVMAGYFEDAAATANAVQDGWLQTGDLGRIDRRGRLEIVGRAKDVVVTAAGESLYLDDLEERLGRVSGVSELALVGLGDPRGGERLGLLAVAEDGVSHDAVRAALADATLDRLAPAARPAVVHVVDAELPRTATRKVKRGPVSEVLTRIAEAHAAAIAVPDGAPRSTAVRHAIAQVAGADADALTGETRLTEELTFDSLMWVELAAALDELPGGQPAAAALARCQTVADVEALLESPALPVLADVVVEEPTFRFPGPAVGPLRKALRAGQRFGYEQGLRVRVIGRAHIPQNRPVLVVSNHASHLDMGLVKTALGPYGEDMVALAAQDYFFEGHPLWVAYFEQLTNLRGLARDTAYRQSLRQASAAVGEGRVVLIFPEGGRQGDGQLHDFKPLVGKLVLETGVDVLPLWLEGTHDVLPRGAVLPRGRDVSVRIGPVLQADDLRRLAGEVKPTRGPRRVTEVLHRAVAALRDGGSLDVATLDSWEPPAPTRDPLAVLFDGLPRRFQPGALDGSKTWYLSLGDAAKWTVTADGATCSVQPGKPTGSADCVVKTSPALWRRMVEEAWAPDPAEFMAGRIKTSDLGLLMQFAQVFRLGPEASPEPEVRA